MRRLLMTEIVSSYIDVVIAGFVAIVKLLLAVC